MYNRIVYHIGDFVRIYHDSTSVTGLIEDVLPFYRGDDFYDTGYIVSRTDQNVSEIVFPNRMEPLNPVKLVRSDFVLVAGGAI